MKKSIFLTLLIFLALSSLGNAADKPIINAYSAILVDSQNGEVHYEKNAKAIMAPASTTKIMTAILALERQNLDKIVTVSPVAASEEGTSMDLSTLERRKVRELLYGLMLVSGNDAASALAISISGTETNFAKLMTNKARQIGMKNTIFKNASGLPEIGHYTTAYDMALLTRYALKNPGFAAIVNTKFKEIPGPKSGQSRLLQNHNKLLWRYPYANGVKTGYTLNAGGCLVSSATYKGQTLIAVVLKTGTIYDDSIKLFNYGFGLN